MSDQSKPVTIDEIIDKIIHYETQPDKFSGLSKVQAISAINKIVMDIIKFDGAGCMITSWEPEDITDNKFISLKELNKRAHQYGLGEIK
jgi:hypothetical protein